MTSHCTNSEESQLSDAEREIVRKIRSQIKQNKRYKSLYASYYTLTKGETFKELHAEHTKQIEELEKKLEKIICK
jgi:ribosomal protein L19E